MGYLQTKIEEYRKTGRKGLILLMDPDKLEGTFFKERLAFAKEFAITGVMTSKT